MAGESMKYTRYDLNIKKRKNERKKMLLSIIGVIIIALVVGIALYKFIGPTLEGESINKILSNDTSDTKNLDNSNTVKDNESVSKNESAQSTSASVVSKQEYIMVQCGVYSKEEGAKTVLSQLEKITSGSIIEDDGKYRVVSYIGDEDNANNIIATLEQNNVATSKAKFSIVKSDNCNNKIAEILNGYIQILNKLSDDNVTSIKTAEFKEWTNAIDENSNAENISIFNELKENVNSLNEEITKNDLQSSYNTIYKILSNFRE